MMPIQEVVIKLEKREYYKCEQCTKAFLDIKDLNKHAVYHQEIYDSHVTSSYVKLEKVEILTCDDCTQCFLNNKDFLLHKLEHIHKSVINARTEKTKLYNNKNIEKPYKCSECNYRFVAMSTLEAHMFVHQPFPHICVCGIGYYKLNDLESHQQLVKCKPQIKDVKPLNNNKTEISEEIIKVKSPVKKKTKLAKKNKEITNGDKGTNGSDYTRLKTLPLDISFKRTSDNKFICPICKNLYNSKTGAELHYRAVHRKERAYVCNICQKTFSQISGLRNHLKIHIGVREFGCQYCNKSFYNIHSRALHERTHTGIKPYKCCFCDKCFSDPSAHARHERIHTGDKKFRCKYCPKAFTDSSALYVHRKRHKTGPRDFRCDQCPKSFYTRSNLRFHVYTVHKRILKFQCDHCDKLFSSKINLKNHIEARHTTNRKTYKCQICFLNLLSKKNLRKHNLVVHEKIRNFTCEICCKQFYDKCGLERHSVIHSNNRTYECEHCGKKYFTKACVAIHIVNVHLRIHCKLCKQYFFTKKDLEKHKLKEIEKCELCEKNFYCKGAAKNHLKTHTVRKFVCDYCRGVFNHRYMIVRHINKHHSETKFECEHCGQKFHVKCDIRSHMKIHLEMLRCSICYKVFYSTVDLKQHKKLGCTPKKYNCKVCGKTFRKLYYFKKHAKKHLAVREKVKCPLCKNKYASKANARRHFQDVHTEEVIY